MLIFINKSRAKKKSLFESLFNALHLFIFQGLKNKHFQAMFIKPVSGNERQNAHLRGTFSSCAPILNFSSVFERGFYSRAYRT